MGGYDPSVDNLQDFCSLLEGTNHLLEVATPDLDAKGKNLIEAETEVREALAGLESATDDLQKEIETSEAQATGAAGDLGSATHRVLETRIPALENQVGGGKEHLHQALTDRATALESQFDEMESRGFEPFGAVLTQEQADFERWTNEADIALAALLEGLVDAVEELGRDLQQAVTDLTEATEDAGKEYDDLGTRVDPSQSDVNRFGVELPQDIQDRCGSAGTALMDDIAALGTFIGDTVSTTQDLLHGLEYDATSLIQDHNQRASDAVDAAGAALEHVDIEFEQTAGDAESSVPEAAAVDDLRPQVETADDNVTEIRALMDAVGQP